MNTSFPLFSVLLGASLLMSADSMGQSDILDARTNYGVGQTVTVTGIITNDGNLGIVRYLQDATAGIALYPGGDWTSNGWPDPQPGDEVTMTAALSEYNGLLEVGPDAITNVEVLSTGNALPDFQTITPAEMNESLEGELVAIEGAMFTNGGTPISGNSTYSFSANGEDGIIYVRNDNELVGQILPAGEVNLFGVVSQFTFDGFGGYQLLPRGNADLVPTSAINLSTQVDQTNITTTSFDLVWNTDVLGNSIVEYGETPALGNSIGDAAAVLDHSISLTDLTPGSIYWARVISVAGEDSTASVIRPYATVSESPGYIRAYFVTTVDHSVATDELAVTLGTNTNDTIAAYIASAEHTLDIAAYNINNTAIVAAINAAAANGVQVRYIAEGQNANIGVQDFDEDIPVLLRLDGEGSGMHNKFIIGDADYTDKAFVLTGSTNFTTNNLNTDPNNLVIFGDQSLARAYTLEFEEMWGSEGALPDAGNAKFGPAKTINTPKRFLIGGSPVELYFSPTDGTTAAIEEAILTTNYDLSFATLSFTRNDLGEAVMNVGSSIFINPQGVIEDANATGSEYETLFNAGIDVYSHVGISGQMHHKYAIIDHSQTLSDPTVVTGSHNWSTTAETNNDENTVVIHDARIANLFYQEFMGILGDMGVDVPSLDGRATAFSAYPNPTAGFLHIVLTSDASVEFVRLRDMSGRVVWSQSIPAGATKLQADIQHLPAGMYLLDGGLGTQTSRILLH